MRKTLLVALLAAAPFTASAADDISYTYAEAGYAKLHLDVPELDNPELDGGYLRGSFAIGEQLHLLGGYGKVSKNFNFDGVRVDTDVDQAEFGVGYHLPFGERLHFIADLSYLRQQFKAKAEGERIEDDAKGGRISAGLRGKPSPRTEAWLKAGYLDGGDFEGDFVGTLGGQIGFNLTWGVVGEVEMIHDDTQYRVGVRASF